jgi:hypothetical protein
MPLSDRRGSGRTPRRSRGPGGDAGLRGRSPPSDGRHRRKSSLSKPRGRRSSPSKPRGRKIVEVTLRCTSRSGQNDVHSSFRRG